MITPPLSICARPALVVQVDLSIFINSYEIIWLAVLSFFIAWVFRA
jgi:hypothetical protein